MTKKVINTIDLYYPVYQREILLSLQDGIEKGVYDSLEIYPNVNGVYNNHPSLRIRGAGNDFRGPTNGVMFFYKNGEPVRICMIPCTGLAFEKIDASNLISTIEFYNDTLADKKININVNDYQQGQFGTPEQGVAKTPNNICCANTKDLFQEFLNDESLISLDACEGNNMMMLYMETEKYIVNVPLHRVASMQKRDDKGVIEKGTILLQDRAGVSPSQVKEMMDAAKRRINQSTDRVCGQEAHYGK